MPCSLLLFTEEIEFVSCNDPASVRVTHLKRDDVTFLTTGAILNIYHNKTIQYGGRQLITPIPHIAGSPLCPSTALMLVTK